MTDTPKWRREIEAILDDAPALPEPPPVYVPHRSDPEMRTVEASGERLGVFAQVPVWAGQATIGAIHAHVRAMCAQVGPFRDKAEPTPDGRFVRIYLVFDGPVALTEGWKAALGILVGQVCPVATVGIGRFSAAG